MELHSCLERFQMSQVWLFFHAPGWKVIWKKLEITYFSEITTVAVRKCTPAWKDVN